jgi:hypothetical protein
MATATESAVKAKKDDVMTAPTVNNGAADDEFSNEYVIDRPSFTPDLLTERDPQDAKKMIFKGLPVQGYWIAHRSFGQTKDEQTGRLRPLLAYLVVLTAPCTCYDRDDKRVDAKPGDEIMVWETAQLLQAIPPSVANHPTKVVHMRMVPQYVAEHPSKPMQKMWRTKFYPSKKNPIIARTQVPGGASVIQQMLSTLPAHMLPGAKAAPQLGMGEGLPAEEPGAF